MSIKKTSNTTPPPEEEDDSKIFPQKLMEILSEPDNQDAICWLPHGKSFIIRNRQLFAEKVMPRYFSRKAKYSSFTRKLNRWNFVRVSSGPEIGAYHHEFFLRDKPQLAAQMFCKNARTMLAMAATHNTMEKKETKVVVAAAANANPLPIASSVPTTQPNQFQQQQQQQNAMETEAPKDPIATAAAMMAPFGGASSLQLLEHQIQILQQQERANRMMIERALLMHQRPPQVQQPVYQQDQLLQMRQMMQMGMQRQRARQPFNKRANAA